MTTAEIRISAADLDGASEAAGAGHVVYGGEEYELLEPGRTLNLYVSSDGRTLCVYHEVPR